MPTYGYECTSCSHEFDVFQSVTDKPVTKCERCGGKVRRLISPVAISFKGSGFHINDYAGGNGGSASSEPAKTDTGSCGGGSCGCGD